MRIAEARLGRGDALAKAVAKYLFKLMAYKDEYEVARLYSDPAFEQRLKDTFEGNFSIKYNLAPPLVARRDAQGRLVKSEYGRWMKPMFSLLARLRFLRGSALDVFGYSEERRTERQLIQDYRASIERALARLDEHNLPKVLELANLPEHIRGFGHVKERHLEEVRKTWRSLDSAVAGSKKLDVAA